MARRASRMLSLRRVLEGVGEGSGISRAIIRELGGGDRVGQEVAKMLLLGNAIETSLRPLSEEGSEEESMLASLIVAAPSSSAPMVGRTGGALATTLERWVNERESRALEQKVLRFRGLVTSGILGAVTAMAATLGPLVGSLSSALGAPSGPGALVYGAAAMTAIGSGTLGAYTSGRRFYANVAVALAAFGIVFLAASPLAAVSVTGLWGVK